jgi:hypothetical protein
MDNKSVATTQTISVCLRRLINDYTALKSALISFRFDSAFANSHVFARRADS